MSSQPADVIRYVRYERDALGAVYAVEVVEAERWSDAFAAPLDREVADVRLVRVRSGAPSAAPSWLHVELSPRRVAEPVATYDVDAGAGLAGRALGEAQWRCVPWRRPPGAPLHEYLLAGAVALRHPEPYPTTEDGQVAALAHFGRRHPPLATLARLRSDALARWLTMNFPTSDAFADAILLARLADADPDLARRLRFLREAVVPEHVDPELAIDRAVLLEQASAWRVVESGMPAAAAAALDAWTRRYRVAYDRHYVAVHHMARAALSALDQARPRIDALLRLSRIGALGALAADERRVFERIDEATRVLQSLPAVPDDAEAVTAGVQLGQPHPHIDALRDTLGDAEQALQLRLRRLAAALAARVLDEEGVGALERVLRALRASDVDALHRVLDDRLVMYIERALSADPPTPLATVAERYPVVTRADLDAAVAAFRGAIEDALAAAPDGRVPLRGAESR